MIDLEIKSFFWRRVILDFLRLTYNILMIFVIQLFGFVVYFREDFFIICLLGLLCVLIMYLRDYLYNISFKDFWKIK
jgi:1,4-dihydroxy-2-naphthoate octaprenyltransferase